MPAIEKRRPNLSLRNEVSFMTLNEIFNLILVICNIIMVIQNGNTKKK